MARLPLVISHRTQAGTMPENTLAGVEAALAAGVDGIELDVRATADGAVVLAHDETLERVAGVPSRVSDLTLEELREVVLQPAHGVPGQHVSGQHLPGQHLPGQHIPRLTEVFQRVAGSAIVIVEVKQPGIHDLVAEEVRRAGSSEWTWIWAFDPAVGRACREALPEVPVSLNVSPGSLGRSGYPDRPVEIAVAQGFAAVSWNHAALDASVVEASRRRGLATYCWTPNTPEEIRRVVEAGVDGVCSDYPDRVREVCAALGGPPGNPPGR